MAHGSCQSQLCGPFICKLDFGQYFQVDCPDNTSQILSHYGGSFHVTHSKRDFTAG